MQLEIVARVVGEVFVAKCRGRIIAGGESQLVHEQLKQAMLETPDVVLQLGEVTFVDSCGLGTLVRMMTHARSRGGDVKLCAVPEPILKTLRMTNLTNVFETHTSDAEAVAACYRRRHSKASNSAASTQTILCFEESADVLAYLRELLRQAGYSVLTTSMLRDAQILLKATRPSLIVLGPRMLQIGETNTQELFRPIAPTVPIFVLDEDFSTCDSGEAGVRLLKKVRHVVPTS
jgi:anti-sigma B factor antagonist